MSSTGTYKMTLLVRFDLARHGCIMRYMVEEFVYVSVLHVCASPPVSRTEFMDDNIDATSLGTVFIIMHHLDTFQYHFPSKPVLVFAQVILV